jgi:hypothetical protein
VRDALALPFRLHDQPVDLRHRRVFAVDDHEPREPTILLRHEDRALRLVERLARGPLGDPDDAVIVGDLLRRQVRAIERVLDRFGDEGVEVCEIVRRAGARR